MKIGDVQEGDLKSCAVLVESLTKHARFSDVTLAQQDLIKGAVMWLGSLAREMGQQWRDSKAQAAKPVTPSRGEPKAVVAEPKIKINPKRHGKKKVK